MALQIRSRRQRKTPVARRVSRRPLKLARERRDEARKQVAAHVDPSAKRKAERSSRADTSSAAADEWLEIKRKSLWESTWNRDRDQLVKLVGPYLGNCPIAETEAPELLAVLKRLERKGIRDTAHRVRAVCGRVVFRYAIATGRASRDISSDLKGALASKGRQNYPAITDPTRVGELLRAIDGYTGQSVTHAALKRAPYLFVRPGELRGVEWSEFDLEGGGGGFRLTA